MESIVPDALVIADNISLPLDTVTTVLAIVGTRGAGKTETCTVLGEELIKQGLPVVFLDPLGVCWGIRSSVDGSGEGLPVTILGGAHGDLQLEPTSGMLVADLVIDNPGAYVLDMSAFDSDAEQDRFATDFAHRLYRAKATSPSVLHLLIDEADSFAPQNPYPGQQRMLGAFNTLARRGRVRGIGMTLITQRPAVLNKNVLSMADCLIAMKLNAPQDHEAVKAYVQRQATAEQTKAMLDSLPTLKAGEAWIYSPAWLQQFERTRIRRRYTFDSSATPKPGEVRITPQVLAPVNLDVLRQRMAETIERAKADDPKALRQRIKDLEERLSRFPENARTELHPCNHEAEIRRLQEELRLARDREEDAAGLRAIISLMQERMEHAGELLRFQGKAVSQMPHLVKEMAAKSKTVIDDGPARAKSRENIPANIPPTEEVEHADLRTPIERRSQNGARNIPRTFPTTQPAKSPTVGHSVDDEVLSGPERRILDAIAWLGALGIDEPEQSAVAFLAGYTYNAGSYNNPRGSLRRRGLVEYLPKSRIRLTEQGLALANSPEVAPTNAELHERVLAKLDGPMRRLLVPLLQAYPRPLPDAELAAAAGYTAGAGSFNNPKGRLRSLGLVEYPQPRHVVARALLFPAENVGV